jgi:hypothetical protein
VSTDQVVGDRALRDPEEAQPLRQRMRAVDPRALRELLALRDPRWSEGEHQAESYLMPV